LHSIHPREVVEGRYGEDWRPQPLEARKARLTELLAKAPTRIHIVEHIEGDGTTIFEHACLTQ
jgi:ATP-dependent DNA ligase